MCAYLMNIERFHENPFETKDTCCIDDESQSAIGAQIWSATIIVITIRIAVVVSFAPSEPAPGSVSPGWGHLLHRLQPVVNIPFLRLASCEQRKEEEILRRAIWCICIRYIARTASWRSELFTSMSTYVKLSAPAAVLLRNLHFP